MSPIKGRNLVTRIDILIDGYSRGEASRGGYEFMLFSVCDERQAPQKPQPLRGGVGEAAAGCSSVQFQFEPCETTNVVGGPIGVNEDMGSNFDH